MTEWLRAGNTAVITGGASGIGRAAAQYYAAQGMNLVIADLHQSELEDAKQSIQPQQGASIQTCVTDVSDFSQVEKLRDFALAEFGSVQCLMNNAGASVHRGKPWENLKQFKLQIEINFWGVVHGCQAFLPSMLANKSASTVINTGSKQGITKPPSNHAYNISKAGVIAYTESIAHALREIENCPVTAHLLIPGFTYTGMISKFVPEKPESAWTPEQVVEFMIDSLARGDFYILCPDNETPRRLDEKRILWSAEDIIRNRPALSRWHADYKADYEAFVE